MRRWQQSSMKWVALSADSEKRTPLLAMMPTAVAVDAGERGDQGRSVARLELVDAAAVDESRDDLSNVEGLARIGGDDSVELGRVVGRGLAGLGAVGRFWRVAEVLEDAAGDANGVAVVDREVIGNPRDCGVDVAAAELLRRHLFAGRRLHQRWPAQEDRAVALDDDVLVAHRRHVGAARRARTHHHRDLRHAERRELGLVVENATEVLAVRKDLVLSRQEGASRIHQVEACHPVVARHLLRPQVFLHRHREVGAALDGGVVGDDHGRAAVDTAHSGDHPGARRLAVVELVRRQRRELEEGRVGVDQCFDTLAREQLAAALVALAAAFVAAGAGRSDALFELLDQTQHLLAIVAVGRVATPHSRFDLFHVSRTSAADRCRSENRRSARPDRLATARLAAPGSRRPRVRTLRGGRA